MIDFQKDVIEKSFVIPIVVDFWAPWCGPCRILGPVIEQIAMEQENQWSLVKVNTEENQDISSTYGIKSIPNVKMFYRGEVIDEFSGALPRQMILEWLKTSLPNPGLLALDKLLAEKEVPEASDLEQLMEEFPDSPEIRIVLSQLILWDDPEKVHKTLETIKMGTPFYDKATYLRDISAFLEMETENDQLLQIKKLLKEGNLEEALTTVIEHIGKDNKAADGKLAKAAIGIFNTLGTQHPLTKKYRKHLDMFL